MKYSVALLLSILCLSMSAGCQTTQLETAWKDPSVTSLQFTKVAVLALNSNPGERRAQEVELVKQIRDAHGVVTYTFVPDEVLRDRERVKQLVRDSGADALAVLRLIESEQRTQYVPGSSSYWGDGYGYYPATYAPGQYMTNTYVRAEVSVYSVRHARLLWVGSSTTVNPSSAKDLARQVSAAAASELRRLKLIP